MKNFSVVLINCPDLVGPLRAAGAIVTACVDRPPEHPVRPGSIVVLAKPNQLTASYALTQASQGQIAIWLAAPDEEEPVPPEIKVLHLPASVDDLLRLCNVNPVGGVIGTAEIGVDYSVRQTQSRGGIGLPQQPQQTVGSSNGQAARPADLAAPLRPIVQDRVADPIPATAPSPASFRAPTIGFAGQPVRTLQQQPSSPVVVHERPTPEPSSIPRGVKLGAELICWAGKGGVGKSTIALSLGAIAAEMGLRTVVVDANRGQGDLRKYLRVNQAYLPSVVDAAASGDPTRAITSPERLAAARPAGLPTVPFSMAFAPNDSQMDPALVTPAVYRDVVGAVRTIADIVIVDTQIIEAADIGGMIDDFVVPELLAGAWGLGISDLSVGADNLLRRLYMLTAKGANPERLMVMLNRTEPTSNFNMDAFISLVQPKALWMGAVEAEHNVTTAFERGDIARSPQLDKVLGQVLHKVTGVMPITREREEEGRQEKQKRRLFRWGR